MRFHSSTIRVNFDFGQHSGLPVRAAVWDTLVVDGYPGTYYEYRAQAGLSDDGFPYVAGILIELPSPPRRDPGLLWREERYLKISARYQRREDASVVRRIIESIRFEFGES
jgi:hypothetical protein